MVGLISMTAAKDSGAPSSSRTSCRSGSSTGSMRVSLSAWRYTSGINWRATSCFTSAAKWILIMLRGTLPLRKPGSRASFCTRLKAGSPAGRTTPGAASPRPQPNPTIGVERGVDGNRARHVLVIVPANEPEAAGHSIEPPGLPGDVPGLGVGPADDQRQGAARRVLDPVLLEEGVEGAALTVMPQL